MAVACIDAFSGVAGDMLLGALVDVGLDEAFLRELPAQLGLGDVGVRIGRVQRAGIAAVKVDFDIPPQPHGRHLRHLIEIVDRSRAPDAVKARARSAFRLIAEVEADIHGSTVERVHLHEVGAVDAILDIVGVTWGFDLLGVSDVRCGPIALGDGHVDTAHGRMPVPAPATARLLEGFAVAPGPAESGELTTPTGAALLRALGARPWPAVFVPRRVGYGAGTREFVARPNVVRLVLAELPAQASGAREDVIVLSTDIDDATPEFLAAAAEALRELGALDVTVSAIAMKKGRMGSRLEVLATPASADELERALFHQTPTLGVRRSTLTRRVLERRIDAIEVLGQRVRVKRARLPDGTLRLKLELDDVRAGALATGRSIYEFSAAAEAVARASPLGV